MTRTLVICMLLARVARADGADPEADEVKLGDPSAKSDPDKVMIRTHVKQQIAKVQYCYEKQLLVTPNLAGTVKVTFTLEADGKVSASAGSGLAAEVDKCVAGVIKGITFDKPSGGKTVVNYPFTFQAAAVASPTVSAGGDPDRVMIRRAIKRSLPKLQYCYEKQLLVDPKLAGTVTVRFTIEADGKVSASAGKGLQAEVDKCVAAVVKDTTFDKPSAGKTEVSYPFAFKPTTDPAPVKIGSIDSDKPTIRRVIKANMSKIQLCYDKQLLKQPTLAGNVTVKFTIETDGKVSAASATGVHPDVATCIANVVKGLVFYKRVAKTEVNYPFEFRPADAPP